MLQQKSEDRVTSKELKKLINKCDINNDIIIEEINRTVVMKERDM